MPAKIVKPLSMAKAGFRSPHVREVVKGTPPGAPLTLYVKKPECPARKSGDEWPKWLFL
jgi:hypothetical protein